MSDVGFGFHGTLPVAIKLLEPGSDEQRAADFLRACGGCGAVRVYADGANALVLERAVPGTPLVELTLRGRDDEAMDVLADVIARMGTAVPVACMPEARDWAVAFDAYRASGDARIPPGLVEAAQREYIDLCESQRDVRLLHGDLHHGNVLFDAGRGWLAIDPKGVIGEAAFETAAALRNPVERPELFLPRVVIERRVRRLAAALELDESRIGRWTFAQAVLCTIWAIEDEEAVEPDHPWIALSTSIHAMFERHPDVAAGNQRRNGYSG
jgi:streptomycin 6-kinase